MRNAIRRIRAGQPRGLVTPLVQNDLFRAHAALFDFYAAFTAGKRVLFDDEQSAWGASVIAPQGTVNVTAVVRDGRARRFAEQNYGAINVRFIAGPDDATYDVVITRDAALRPRLAPNGIWISTAEPPPGFATTMRFVQTADGPVDFASPFPSQATFDVRLGETTAATITTIHVATDRLLQLHLGSGPIALPQWINIDNQPYPGVDFRWDLARGIPFRDVRLIFAEHFIEHLSFDQAERFVRNCRAALRDDGILRLSTPNLDWVLRTSQATADALRNCFDVNRAFRGWGHQFLYNLDTLTMLLRDAGFAAVKRFDYGQSDTPALRGIERHEEYPDAPGLPHILIVEASGRSDERPPAHPMREEYRRDVAVR